MYYSTAKEMEKLDKLSMAGGLSIRQMMELAGYHIILLFKILKIKKTAYVTVVCGKGNKGGDGLSAARHLVNNGFKNVNVVLMSKQLKIDPKHHLKLLKKMKVPTYFYTNKIVKHSVFNKTDVFIDALIGYNLKGSPRGVFADVIEIINKSGKKIISYDLPSGVDATTGECFTPCVKANTTLTLALPKRIFKTKTGRKVSGKIYLADIGIPKIFYDKIHKNSRPDFISSLLLRI